MPAQLVVARMGMTQGVTGWPVTLAHKARKPHAAASTQATVNKLKKNTAPIINITMRTVQRMVQFKKSFKTLPFHRSQRTRR